MISQLTGLLAEKAADRVVIDVQGVGYDVVIPFSTYYDLGEVGSRVSLKIHTHVREDALSLFGFSTLREKRIFLQLIQISGIGPRLAVTILSGLPLDDFLRAVAARDVVRLATIPGVGKKTAERIALELKDKVSDLLPGEPSGPVVSTDDMLTKDVLSALVNLGYQKAKSETVLSKLRKEKTIDRFDVLLRSALRELSG